MKPTSVRAMNDELRQIIGEALGEASMCWDPPPGGQVFDSERAVSIIDRVMRKISYVEPTLPDTIRPFTNEQSCEVCGALFTGLGSTCPDHKKAKVAKIHIEGRKNYCRGCGKPDHRGLCDECAFPKKASVSDADELAHNLLINTHFFLKDNRDGLHPAHFRHIKLLEEGTRTLVKELDKEAPETAQIYADGHSENCQPGCKTAGAGDFAAKAGKWMAKSINTSAKNVGKTVRDFRTPIKSMKAGWHSDNRFGKALTLGAAGMDAHDALRKEDPTGQNRGRGQRVGAAIGNTAGGLIGLRHGMFSGGIAGSALGSAIGGGVGRVGDRVARVRRPVQPVQPVGAVQ